MSDRPDVTASPGEITSLGLPYWARRVGVFSWLLVGFLLAVGATALLLAATSAITGPLVIAVLLAIVFAPVVTWLCDRGVPRALAAAGVLFGLANRRLNRHLPAEGRAKIKLRPQLMR